MIKVENNSVHIGIERTELTEQLMKINKKATMMAVIATDLQYLFMALFERFGEPATAELIEQALKTAHDSKYVVMEDNSNAKDNT